MTLGGCSADICPVSDGVCQLRLDFASFAISGPSTATASVAKTLFGRVVDPAQANAKSVSVATQCLIDTFQVASVGGSSASDVICGTNNNEHCDESV